MPSTTTPLRVRFLPLVACLALSACGDDDRPPVEVDAGPGDTGVAMIDAAVAMDAGFDAAVPMDAGFDTGVSTDAGNDAGTDALPPRDGGDDPVPVFRNPRADLSDPELAMQALAILGSDAAGATTPYCSTCHTLTRTRIRYWRALSDASLTNCLTDLGVSTDASAASMLTCLRGATDYTAASLGIWATASQLPWFQYVFRHGGSVDWMTDHAAFVAAAGMPRGTDPPMTQAQFDIVAEWFLRGVPNLDTVLPADPRPTECLPGVTSDVGAHVTAMATDGWGARNAAAGMLMHGCAGAATARDCLSTVPLASTTTYGATWETISSGGVPGAHLRVLYQTTYASAYWTRSSPDGRFVSHGAATAPRLRFIDLTGPRVIGGNANYDTVFFPDGTGFVVQNAMTGARICEQSVLTTGMPTMLTFSEVGCSAGTGIGLYEHVGASLGGGDYWAIDGTATYDNGGQTPTLTDPIADFDGTARSDLTLMTNDGTRFVVGGTVRVPHPYEGDATISQSLRLIVTRLGGATSQLGFVLRRVDTTGAGATLRVATPEIGRYCFNGGKPAFSYDERWMVYHHYIGDSDATDLGFTGPMDPGFAAYRTRGAANVYMIDLTNGRRYRITNMGPGQYALFPHFRSDGWMYIQVRTESATPEQVVASDAALVIVP